MKKQTAGRTNLGEFAPKFAELNDDVLFGEVWSREDKLSARDRSRVTVTALLAQGLEGLLVAGRCGSYTHMGLAAGKSMGNMMAIGQAAGAAAARACALSVAPRALPYAEVRAALDALGARL